MNELFSLTKEECRESGLCKKCYEPLEKFECGNIRAKYIYFNKCPNCGKTFYGLNVNGQEKNPYYFLQRSFKYMLAFLKKNHYKNYKEYLNSDHWKEIRKQYSGNCVICGQPGQIHHRDYRRIGRELERDLICLCGNHHCYVHLKAKEPSRGMIRWMMYKNKKKKH